MVKVLLVYEDFNELTLFESVLKKVGFDVLGITNELSLGDKILAFNPDIVVSNGTNNRVSSFSVGQKLKENRGFSGKSVLVLPKNLRPNPEQIMRVKMDAIIEAPVTYEKMIQVLAKVAQMDSAALVDKFQKLKLSDIGSMDVELKRNPSVSNESYDRKKRYREVIESSKTVDLQSTTFEKSELKKRQTQMKKDWDFNALEKIDELKRQFASALFKKPKNK